MTTTAEIVAGMMKENTGKHFLDSGGEGGRNWQFNQVRDFASEPPVTLSGRYDLSVTINLYHWLCEKLKYWPEMQELFDAHSADSNESYLHDMESFKDYLEDHGHPGYRVECTDNSYNHENLLSQTIQFTVLCHDDEESIILLQVHGGADVRGGYTAPKAFKIGRNCEMWWEFTDYRSAHIGCKCGAQWHTDDAYHWYSNWSDGVKDYQDLNKYDTVKHEEEVKVGDVTITVTGPQEGIMYVDDDDNVYCPVCAKHKLEASWY